MSARRAIAAHVIKELIAARPIATQEELRALLAERGHDVTQATLSRDLAQLGAHRTAHGYELPDVAAPPALPDLCARSTTTARSS